MTTGASRDPPPLTRPLGMRSSMIGPLGRCRHPIPYHRDRMTTASWGRRRRHPGPPASDPETRCTPDILVDTPCTPIPTPPATPCLELSSKLAEPWTNDSEFQDCLAPEKPRFVTRLGLPGACGVYLISMAGMTKKGGGGYTYLLEPFWWAGLITMLLGEIANFVAYVFAPTVLVTPLGALSIIVSVSALCAEGVS